MKRYLLFSENILSRSIDEWITFIGDFDTIQEAGKTAITLDGQKYVIIDIETTIILEQGNINDLRRRLEK